MNPIATIYMKNKAKIVLELLPGAAPNTVNSFLYGVKHKIYDHTKIERIVPGSWIDMSYRAFGQEKARYLIPNEFALNPDLRPLESTPGCVCMGGYGELGLSGCEFFFPLRNCPEHRGIYPVFGYVREGMEELYRLEGVETRPVTNYPEPGIIINEPIMPQIVEQVTIDLFGKIYKDPICVQHSQLPSCWS